MPKNKITLKSVLRLTLLSVIFFIGVYLVPHSWCAREASQIFNNKGDIQNRMAAQAEMLVSNEIVRKNFKTGSDLFNGEWLFGTYMMAGMGFGQMAVLNPDRKEEYCLAMEKCIRQILSPAVREFDRQSWQSDPIDSLDTDHDHAAYLGYFNLLLSLHRLLKNESEYSGLNDRITEALARRLNKSPVLLLQTYPGEYYPVDNCAGIASIGLYDKATGKDHSELLERCVSRMKANYTDKKTGLLYQCIDGSNGVPADLPRGSGTCLGLYFLSFMDAEFSKSLYLSMKRELRGGVLGFGGIKEYPASCKGERGDIDSGPVILGYGLSATGFAIAGTRIHNDSEMFGGLYATAYLCGAPSDAKGKRNFVTGGHIGNAIMFAMLTALSKEEFAKFSGRSGK